MPGAPPKVIPGLPKPKAAPVVVAAPAPEPEASDPTVEKVNDRGGKGRDRHGAGRGGKVAPGEARAHPRRHEYDITGRGGGKEASRGGRGPGGWGSHHEEAHRAEKNPDEVAEEAAAVAAPAEESTPEEEPKVVVPEAPAVFGLDEYLNRRSTLRANEELFGTVEERKVQADASLKVLKKEDVEETHTESKGAKKVQRSANKTVLDAGFTVASTVPYVPREREPRTEGRGGGRGGRGDGRGSGGRGGRGRDSGSGRGRGSAAKLHAEDFPAL